LDMSNPPLRLSSYVRTDLDRLTCMFTQSKFDSKAKNRRRGVGHVQYVQPLTSVVKVTGG
jgi:hypothetical protein